MKVSELISKLEELKQQHGDLPCKTLTFDSMLVYDVDTVELETVFDGHSREKELCIVIDAES